jgi:hypothetical protein
LALPAGVLGLGVELSPPQAHPLSLPSCQEFGHKEVRKEERKGKKKKNQKQNTSTYYGKKLFLSILILL